MRGGLVDERGQIMTLGERIDLIMRIDAGLSPTQKLIMMMINQLSGINAGAWPHVQTLGHFCCINQRKTVQRNLDTLCGKEGGPALLLIHHAGDALPNGMPPRPPGARGRRASYYVIDFEVVLLHQNPALHRRERVRNAPQDGGGGERERTADSGSIQTRTVDARAAYGCNETRSEGKADAPGASALPASASILPPSASVSTPISIKEGVKEKNTTTTTTGALPEADPDRVGVVEGMLLSAGIPDGDVAALAALPWASEDWTGAKIEGARLDEKSERVGSAAAVLPARMRAGGPPGAREDRAWREKIAPTRRAELDAARRLEKKISDERAAEQRDRNAADDKAWLEGKSDNDLAALREALLASGRLKGFSADRLAAAPTERLRGRFAVSLLREFETARGAAGVMA
ncbi:helix-turn-helix domain-containing protein [Planctomycetaceae bacterium AH-315-I19]|nr:helix-turn-helix domain-containing protein [Planctomycetaceae bacterium AH-315-I19]